MTMKADAPKFAGISKALAPAIAAVSVAAPAFAEGTGEVLVRPTSSLAFSAPALPFLSHSWLWLWISTSHSKFGSKHQNSYLASSHRRGSAAAIDLVREYLCLR